MKLLTLFKKSTGGAVQPFYAVNFDGNGADGGNMTPQIASGVTALTMNAFTLTGMNFTSWNTAANGSGTSYGDMANFNFNVNKTLYARWENIPHTVTFEGNGADGGSMSPQVSNSPANLTDIGFTLTGMIFANWNTAADGSGTSYANQEEYSFSADITLYAQWLP